MIYEHSNHRERLESLVKIGNRFRLCPIVDDEFADLRDRFDQELALATGYIQRNHPKIICLCGSTRFRTEYEMANEDLTRLGYIVLSVGCFRRTAPDGQRNSDEEAIKIALDELHLKKIDLADGVYVINPGGYIGESTRREIEHATRTGKTVRYLVPPDGCPAVPPAVN